MLSLQRAQDGLMEADYRVGKARHIARKNGFSDVFRQHTCVTGHPILKFRRTQFPFFVKFWTFVHWVWYTAEDHIATLPDGENFTITLD
jgi:hypothetical protein